MDRFIIGIDLGTTNCSVAYVDTAEGQWVVRDFAVGQVVAPDTFESRLTLPSCHYQAAPGEFAPGALRLAWSGAAGNTGESRRDTHGRSSAVGDSAGGGTGGTERPSVAGNTGESRRDTHGRSSVVGDSAGGGTGGTERPSVAGNPGQCRQGTHGRSSAVGDSAGEGTGGTERPSAPGNPGECRKGTHGGASAVGDSAGGGTGGTERPSAAGNPVTPARSGEDPREVVGFFARDHGAAVPGRLAVSAKSWLCHNGVDRTAGLLPWHGAADVQRLSPVDVSAALLGHIRQAWDHAHPHYPLSQQDVVLTVPASFDEVARQLTVEAARRAGLVKLTLAEEPQAAFYAWINAHGGNWQELVHPGQTVLVCDIGGGTTDLTLIRVRPAKGEKGEESGGGVMFHRIAVGQHLLLGGDNLDLALAQHIEAQITSGGRLPLHQWGPLLRSASAIKETLLDEAAPPRLTVNIASSSSRLIGGGRQVELSTEQVRALLLDGFLPRTGLSERPATVRSGFQEFNLPYAADPAITRYIAQFLTSHAGGDGATSSWTNPPAVVPDTVLLNGGFFASGLLRQRLLEVLSSWFTAPGAPPWHPQVLENDRLDLAVSRGAGYYGMVRRGRGVRISGGLAHSYYIAVDRPADAATSAPAALCLLPAGVEEGQEVHLEQVINLLIRQPVEFGLYLSSTRTTDAPGALVDVDGEQLTALPPIRTVLQSGRKAAADTVGVHLHARLTEIGTLELWAAELAGHRKWRLDFDVRSANRAEYAQHMGKAEAQGVIDASILPAAQGLIGDAFGGQPATAADPAGLVRRLEALVGMPRADWPPTLLRNLWEMLLAVPDARRVSVEHEVRWLNLLGFCLRPGFGLAVDDWRVAQTWRLASQKPHYPRNEQCRAEWWILWRRIAGGLSAGQQLTLAQPLLAAVRSRLRPAGAIPQSKTSAFQYGPHESAEVWRLLGSLELLAVEQKVELGQTILALVGREKPSAVAAAALFALGRLGARVPVYGPLNGVLAAEVAAGWADRLVALAEQLPEQLPHIHFALLQLARRTDDRYRDLPEVTTAAVGSFLASGGAPAHFVELVRKGGQLEQEEQKLAFGESLPRGLSIA